MSSSRIIKYLVVILTKQSKYTMKSLLFIFFQAILCTCLLNAQNVNGNLPFEISLDQIASGFSSPIDIANAGDSRLFIVERSGRIRILNEDGTTNSNAFLDIDSRVTNSGGQSEQGLLALEFHPDFESNGFFFVHYTDNGGNTVISRFSVDPNDGNLGLSNSEEIIYTALQPFGNHNGGSIKFGPDGMLYIGLGDGGAANDPQNLAQNPTSPMGKMLRLDVDNGLPYTIPADNPFINDADVLDEIWSLGHRNPWKWSFDRATGDIWMADVGQNLWEEVNFQPADSPGGENYGWRCREGAHNAITSGCSGTFDEPVAEYNHEGFTHCSVTGGYVYRGAEQIFNDAPPIYLYADYCSGTFWGTYPEATANGDFRSAELNRVNGVAISTFGEDMNGELYAAALNNGRIYRVNADCNIDVDILMASESCESANNGRIYLSEDEAPFYELEVVSLSDPTTILDPNELSAGSYQVTASRFGCTSVSNVNVAVELEPIDVAVVELSDNSFEVTVSTPAQSYQWYFNGMLIEGETSSTIIVSESGSYRVEITLENGCVNTSDFVIQTSNTDRIESIEAWELVPNPVNDILTMKLTVSKNEDLSLSIVDASGKELSKRKFAVGGEESISIDMSNYSEGVYLLILSNGVSTQTQKVVKQ